MKLRGISFGYTAVVAALTLGCLYAGSGLDVRQASAAETPTEDNDIQARPASFLMADPLPDDTTDQMAQPAEKIFKNIQTLKGISGHELIAEMEMFSNALGVRCSFCHVQQDFSLDDKPEKKTTRGMIQMAEDINAKNFGTLTVTCYTCHQGSPHPVSVPSLAQGDWQKTDLKDEETFDRERSTTLDDVLNRYVEALGGEKALARIATRSATVSETGPEGAVTTVDVLQKAPDMIRTTATDPQRGEFTVVYNGRTGMMHSGNHPPREIDNNDLEQVRRMAELFPATNLRNSFSSVELLGKRGIGGRDYHVVLASRDKSTDRLYFDATTGLLVRRYVEFHTPLGAIPFSAEYQDYREVDGVKIPFTIKWDTPREHSVDTYSNVRQNVPIDDSKFTVQP